MSEDWTPHTVWPTPVLVLPGHGQDGRIQARLEHLQLGNEDEHNNHNLMGVDEVHPTYAQVNCDFGSVLRKQVTSRLACA